MPIAFHPHRLSPVHRSLEARGARWAETGGWRIPEAFTDPTIEAQGVRQGVGLQDVTAIGKVDLKGHDLAALWKGGAAPDGIAALHLTPEHWLILTPPGAETETARSLLSGPGGNGACLHVTDVTSALSALAVVGPRARDLLSRLSPLDLRPTTLPDHSCAQGQLALVHAVVHRQDWGALPAFGILVGRDVAEYVWDAVCAAGEPFGLTLFGRAAEQRLRAGA